VHTKETLNKTLLYLILLAGLSFQEAHDLRVAVTLALERKYHLERHSFALTPVQHVCIAKFRQGTILLPFGYYRAPHIILNP
jgi:hypothetical protein